MSYTDVIKKSVLESFSSTDMSAPYIAIVLIETFVIALYIFLVYRYMTRNAFYNKNFAVAMSIISVITAGIILAMQSNIVISLGMVGALSIVRFRTAIKEPMDLLFLFWSIGTGIVVGAGLFSVGVVLAVFVTIGLVVLNMVPAVHASELLIVKFSGAGEKQIMDVLRKGTKTFKVDSKSTAVDVTTLVVEVKTQKSSELVDTISGIDGVSFATIMRHDGELKY